MSIFTVFRDQELPTAAKLQRVWAHCILAQLVKDMGAYPATSTEWRMMHFGAGAAQASRGVGLTSTESAVYRLRKSLDIALWVHAQLYDLGALRFGVAYESYVNQLSSEEIAAMVDTTPQAVLQVKLENARHLNRCVRHVAKVSGHWEVEDAA